MTMTRAAVVGRVGGLAAALGVGAGIGKAVLPNLPTSQLTAFRIQPWFGGTSLPPNRLSLYLKTNCWWNSI